MRKYIVGLALMMLLVSSVRAQNPDEIVTLDIKSETAVLKAGTDNPLIFEIRILSPFHINSDKPSEEFLVGTAIEFDEQAGVAFGDPVFPSSQMRTFEFSQVPLAIFEGTIEVKLNVSISPEFSGKNMTISGRLSYQACDDVSCKAPAELVFRRVFEVDEGAGGPDADSPESVPQEKAAASEPLDKSEGPPAEHEPVKTEAVSYTHLTLPTN